MKSETPSDKTVLTKIIDAFASVAKPEHFTDYNHCEECAEHDELLRSRNRFSLQFADVGNPGWDPLCFTSAGRLRLLFSRTRTNRIGTSHTSARLVRSFAPLPPDLQRREKPPFFRLYPRSEVCSAHVARSPATHARLFLGKIFGF